MPSPRTEPTAGFLRRLEVRLVLALSSIALAALLFSGIALSYILPGFFKTQTQQQLSAGAAATLTLIQNRINQQLEADPSVKITRDLLDNLIMPRAAQEAADNIAHGTVTITNADTGQQTAQATPKNAGTLGTQFAVDPGVGTGKAKGTIDLTADESPPPDKQLTVVVVVSNPYTTRAAIEEQVRGTLIAAGIIAFLGSILLGLFAARQLTGSLNRLRRVSSRLAQGHLEERVPPAGVMEIDQLGSQFNVMADRLSESLRLLETDRDRLREFVADVSHELRTPIAALRTFTELQRDGSIDDATRQEFLVRSSEQLRRLEWLSTNLLDLSRIEAGIFPLDVREGDLREPIRAVVEAHAEVAEAREVSLTSAVPSDPVTLRFDRERVVQLVNNLVGNALKFTPAGGQVEIEVADAPDAATIVVRDSGPGIPEQELPHIFDRFYRGTNVGEARASGSGLGLAIVRSIVDMHGGDISVASAVDRGTAFTVTLPRIPEPFAASEMDAEASSRNGPRRQQNRPEASSAPDRAR